MLKEERSAKAGAESVLGKEAYYWHDVGLGDNTKPSAGSGIQCLKLGLELGVYTCSFTEKK